MKRSFTLTAAFWGLCAIALVWCGMAWMVELHLGWPRTASQWVWRLLGWGLEVWMIRTLALGIGRYYGAVAGSTARAVGRGGALSTARVARGSQFRS